MTTIGLILIILIVALILWLVQVPEILKRLLYAIVIIAFFVWLMALFGLLSRTLP